MINETRIGIVKRDAAKQIAYGEVYVPYVPDSQGDFMTPAEIERVAHNFLRRGRTDAIDTEHNLVKSGDNVVESFVAREGDPDFHAGAWVLGVHVPDKQRWAKVEAGEIGGFSMYGSGRRVQRVVEVDVPDDGCLFVKTEASSRAPHAHMAVLYFDDTGKFTGGETNEVNGHSHVIRKGTVTEPGPDGERHRFSFIDALAKTEEVDEVTKAWMAGKRKGKKSCKKADDVEKRDFSTKQRDKMAEAGTAMPDGSFPIATADDLHNAIAAVGRAKSYEAAKAHIIARAKAMGLTAQLPSAWGVKKDDMSMSDMPAKNPEQGQKPCAKCQTPKTCKKGGKCMMDEEDKMEGGKENDADGDE